VDIIYKLAVDQETPETWKAILEQGGSFGDAANATSGPKSPHGGGDEYSHATIYSGGPSFKDLQEKLFTMQEGESAVLEGEMGTYLVSVDARKEGRELEFDESREEVRVRLIRQRISNIIDRKVDELAASVKVKISDSYMPAEPMEDFPRPDLG
jgi:hypothetical protein